MKRVTRASDLPDAPPRPPPPSPLRTVAVLAPTVVRPPPSRPPLRSRTNVRSIRLFAEGEQKMLPTDLRTHIKPRKENNFYIYPAEVIKLLYDKTLGLITPKHEELRLRVLGKMMDDQIFGQPDLAPVRNFSNEDRVNNPIGFIWNEYQRLYYGIDVDDFYPHFFEDNTGLVIPSHDVRDLPVYLMLYILERLVSKANSLGSVHVGYQISIDEPPSPETTCTMIKKGNSVDQDVTFANGNISMKAVYDIYMTLLRVFTTTLPGSVAANGIQTPAEVSWAGSEESGTRILLLDSDGTRRPIYIKLIFFNAHGQRIPGTWSLEVENLLKESLGNTVLSVRNKSDNKCLIYCLVLGLIIKLKDGASRLIGFGLNMVDDIEVYSKGLYMFTDDDPVSITIRRLARCLLSPDYSDGPVDPISLYVKDLDKEVGTMLTIDGFREKFEEIEEKLIPADVCGVDVYGIDYNINKHVYPLYISKRRDRVIQLLCVTPLDAECSHFCLITNFEKLMKRSGGKQFYTCSKCGEAFYHRRLLGEHSCPATPNSDLVDGDGGYHYSCKMATKDDMIVGVCPKCRLCFIQDFCYEYHKKHCLMAGKTGYRHVQLVTYKHDEHPSLNGEAVDKEDEKKHVKSRRVLYADFESSINPETGEHSFMSFGLYDTKAEKYISDYDLGKMFTYLVDNVCQDSEDHIYVYFHNAMNYDANFILRYVLSHEEYASWGIQVIMKSSNKLQKLVFYINNPDEKRKAIHICDTFLFLTLSLERIVGSIRKDDLQQNLTNFPRFFGVFSGMYPGVPVEKVDHILRKNIFPYKFFTDSEKLKTNIDDFRKIFEPREENLKYFSERVTVEQLAAGYADTCDVIDTFRCTSAAAYHDLYLCCDVMQLTDVFERSMKILWETHNIHLTRYLGMPSASWAAFLRHDPTMSIPLYEDTFFAEFFKGMIRGGITSAALRHAVADDKHSILYLDVNGLYPFVMQKYKFPCGLLQYEHIQEEGVEQCKQRLTSLFEEFERTGTGMCFCVDLHIPDDVKEKTDMYPFAPEHRKIYKEYYKDFDKKELTPFLERWSTANDGAKMTEFTGLVCTLYDKEEYNTHWRLLKFYLEHGVEVTKIHFGVSFKEGDYLAGYIRKNIQIRNERSDELGKTLYKLLGNSIYGKTFESPFKRNTFEIVRDPIKLQGMLEEGNIASLTPIDEFGWIVRMEGEDIVLDKPTYIGACVCEFAKLHMYTLLYDKLMSIFPNCQMVYTDTDSFIIYVEHPEGVTETNLFEYIKMKDPDLIGGIGGQVKSETGDDTIQEVIALRSKVYTYKTKKGKIGKRAKGTPYDAQELKLDFETYQMVLRSLTSYDVVCDQFVRKVFKISSKDMLRRSLSVNDGKRYVCPDGIHTHAFGHPSLL